MVVVHPALFWFTLGSFICNTNEDFAAFNHAFEYLKADSSQFLLPQRRERVWGSSCIGADQSKYEMDMKMCMQRLKSPARFTLEHLVRDDLPEDVPPSGIFVEHLENMKKICQDRNVSLSKVAMDVSTGRTRAPEWAHNMLTCVRPTHKIWLCGQHRFATPQEALRSHGVFFEEFPAPQVLGSLDPTLALDLAGNAFSTTVLMAKILCTMVHAFPWQQLSNCAPPARPGIFKECVDNAEKIGSGPGKQEGEGSEPPARPAKKARTARTTKSRKRKSPEDDPEGGPRLDKNKQSRGQSTKGSLLTIAKKLDILKKYEALKETEKHPEKDHDSG